MKIYGQNLYYYKNFAIFQEENTLIKSLISKKVRNVRKTFEKRKFGVFGKNPFGSFSIANIFVDVKGLFMLNKFS
jgi:hypothetical protein